jgi:hypothetical protein
MLLAMFGRLQIAAIFLLSLSVYPQTGPARLVAEIDLKQLGVNVPAKGSVSTTSLELLFLSDNYLILLQENHRPDKSMNRLTVYEIGEGIFRPKKTIDPGEGVLPISPSGAPSVKVLERIDSEHFVYWAYRGKSARWLCDTDLNCKEDKEESALETVPPRGFVGPPIFSALSMLTGPCAWLFVAGLSGQRTWMIPPAIFCTRWNRGPCLGTQEW